ncbi:hypothetical protein Ga0609869_003584 [Rhodovulum iodosum]|uniref:Sulfotransferase domain-containing protein n=1 Tax=Rhodovulum iodosum TaxID=68291 RepID=A0ABV3XXX6_9RHOB|nr:sulfotransferase domain-containing protein [Rhodovulum robiginosum]RSK38874.1 sulfotransferase [Rhodovulum robiginosum]
MALPDYLIIGAMKCGTSTLAAQLEAQPGMFMTTPKEPNFFSDDAVFARGPGWYEALFDAAAPGDLKGEASTHYTKLPTHPDTLARLAAMLEAPKLIYLIRDPVARAVSHYIHGWSMGEIADEIGPALTHHPELVSYGCYGMQIAPWIARFGRDRVFVGTLNEMQRNPQRFLDRVGAFLDRPGLVWQADLGRVNASAERIRRLPLHGLLVDNPLATALRRTMVPQALRDRVKAARQMQTRPEIPARDLARAKAVFAEDRDRLMALFPGRPDLADCYTCLQP